MQAFYAPLSELESYKKLEEHVRSGGEGIFAAGGCLDVQRAQLAGALGENGRHMPRILITWDEPRARQILENCLFFEPEAVYFPPRDILFYQSDVRGNALTVDRMAAYRALEEQETPLIVTTMDAVMEKLIPPEALFGAYLDVRPGQEFDLSEARGWLTGMGYECCAQAEQPGQFAVRGGILDVFPVTEELPVRIELWGDEVDTIRRFDAESQRSVENLDEVRIRRACEMVLDEERTKRGIGQMRRDMEEAAAQFRSGKKSAEAARIRENSRYIMDQIRSLRNVRAAETCVSYFYDKTASLLDYAEYASKGGKPIVILDEPGRCMERAHRAEEEFAGSMGQRLAKGYILPRQADVLTAAKDTAEKISRMCAVSLSALDREEALLPAAERVHFSMQPVSAYNGKFDLLVKDLQQYHREGYRLLLLSGSRTRGRRMAEDLTEEGVPAFFGEDPDRVLLSGETMVLQGKLSGGFAYPGLGFAVLTENDIFGRRKAKRKKKKKYEGESIQDFSELSIGDYVVHERHGLGIYRGIEKVEVEGTVRDYIKIEYADGGNLYILPTQLDMIQKYAGADSAKPHLNRLGSPEWGKTKSRVQGAVKNIAKELVELYAVRQSRKGYACGPDTVWQQEFEEMFPYEETEDQLSAIEATKRDMESTKIMDRLICGDVGFGKTEVAIRAAFKEVQESRQVAYLVPTTILAKQHYNTFTSRMADFPVNVKLLCRFNTAKEQKETIAELKSGKCDIVIGTHRLLSKDVSFRNLGLLIIDEEQRFGVSDKEKIKQLKKDVDVLTLTATPIPRTLHMSLIGIRDISVLEEPPQDRLPVQTYVMEYDEEMVREAITREISRNGQVYYVFNRVSQIEETTARIAALVPEARVAFAHGQMYERDLEDVMARFIDREIDVLVSTTIIETGLDISNVNTMIVQDADRMGLSQLYQLRGRIGRSSRTSYAFLMYRRDKVLREEAEKRLTAIRDFSELGSGFKIAMKDLEIRGAGNLLGAEQHGHMEAVGYDLYCKMLNQEIKKLKGGEAQEEEYETVVELDTDAYIPASYIPSEEQKLDIYRRISCVDSKEEASDLTDELIDRFGEPPKPVMTLLQVAELKTRAHSLYITKISEKGGELSFDLYEKAKVNAARIPQMMERFRPDLTFHADPQNPSFTYRKRKKGVETIAFIDAFLDAFEEELLDR